MQKFTNPLDNIKIASPCPADWNEMYGDERKRFCSDCNLNVYNLSDMTKQEAEKFLINSEGRVCVKFYRRKDGTVITKNCPIAWQKLKRKVSRVSTAAFAVIASFSISLTAMKAINSLNWLINIHNKAEETYKPSSEESQFTVYGTVSNLPAVKEELDEDDDGTTEFTGYIIRDSWW